MRVVAIAPSKSDRGCNRPTHEFWAVLNDRSGYREQSILFLRAAGNTAAKTKMLQNLFLT